MKINRLSQIVSAMLYEELNEGDIFYLTNPRLLCMKMDEDEDKHNWTYYVELTSGTMRVMADEIAVKRVYYELNGVEKKADTK